VENKKEREIDELVHLIGFFDRWEMMEKISVQGYDVLGKRVLRPRASSQFIAIHPRIKIAVTDFDLELLKHFLIPNKLLRFSIHIATEDDIIVHMAKEKFDSL